MLKIEGRTYWGDEASLQGWEVNVGHFEILDARPNFRRYIAHQNIDVKQLTEKYSIIAELARKYETEPTKIISTHGKYYTCEKYRNIFFLGKSTNCKNDLDTIQRVLDNTKLKKELLLSIELKLWKGESSSGVILDVKEPLKKVHADLFRSLDSILFAK